ncbi:unnamed protein product [Linum tenue]|uniref:Secreted protein n=1 Tax=Linum tenue TaxID=586396 RepID=A0AAV0KGF1_9ROSI|nr:unnamed protein product [Linum tenue]
MLVQPTQILVATAVAALPPMAVVGAVDFLAEVADPDMAAVAALLTHLLFPLLLQDQPTEQGCLGPGPITIHPVRRAARFNVTPAMAMAISLNTVPTPHSRPAIHPRPTTPPPQPPKTG